MNRIQTHNFMIGTDCIGSCKSNYHAITTTTTPSCKCVLDTTLCDKSDCHDILLTDAKHQ